MPDNIEIQVYEVLTPKIDYSKSVDELVAYFDEELEKINRGERKADLELMMLGYAIDFLVIVKRAADIVLDFEEAAMPVYEAVLEALHRNYAGSPPTSEQFSDTLKKAAGFMCVVILKNIGGDLINTNLGLGVNISGTNAFVMNRVGRCLQNGSEDDVISFYEALKNL